MIRFEGDTLGYGTVTIGNTAGFGLKEGINIAIGPNGSGKTTLGTILAKGRHAYGNRISFVPADMKVRMLAFNDIHSLSGMETTHFSQRMEAFMNDYVPTVADVLGPRADSPRWHELTERLGLRDATEKKVNYLSSGELRKLLIANALLSETDLLILDNPYIGLDAPSRRELDILLSELSHSGLSLLLLVCDPADIHPEAAQIIVLENCTVKESVPRQTYLDSLAGNEKKHNPAASGLSLPGYPVRERREHGTAFAISGGHARYGAKTIFENLDWRVARGETWALTGRNGSGKSLLLSMVCADNPQGYANDITLFDRKRGTGESIWEIKDRIGYVSPEMQLFFKSADSILDIVVQGMRNSLNRYRPALPEERLTAAKWLEILRISHLSDRKFGSLSSGEQRLVLVARAVVSQPDLLVLDEPLHGLDSVNKANVRNVIDTLTRRNGNALIFVTHNPEEVPGCVTHTMRMPS